jgi:predicted CoA-binding protein
MPTVAVLGASSEHRKFGNQAVRAYLHAGGRVLPDNLTETEIEGLAVYPKLADLPEPPDRIAVYLPPPVTLGALPEIAAAGAGDVFFNPGSADRAVVAEAERLGIPARQACAIVAIGLSPSQFP